ncbi:radical SAM protein, partial [bacterium]|nr:radical SAM protein [bacterium]
MPAIVNSVIENSIADELEIECGDEILSIDENQMADMIDYNFYCKSEFLTLEVKKKNGEIEVIEIEKDYDED